MGGEYRYVAARVEGFVQQLAVSYLKNGCWFYALGEVPAGKPPEAVDEKLLLKYQLENSKWANARASRRGEAKAQYLRYERTFVLVATHGRHRFFDEEAGAIRDARESPVRFYGYSLSYRDGHPHVRIAGEQYRALAEAFLEAALTLPAESLAARFLSLPFEPYGPVRMQLRRLWVKVNRARRAGGLEKVPVMCLRTARRAVKPFAESAATGEVCAAIPL